MAPPRPSARQLLALSQLCWSGQPVHGGTVVPPFRALAQLQNIHSDANSGAGQSPYTSELSGGPVAAKQPATPPEQTTKAGRSVWHEGKVQASSGRTGRPFPQSPVYSRVVDSASSADGVEFGLPLRGPGNTSRLVPVGHRRSDRSQGHRSSDRSQAAMTTHAHTQSSGWDGGDGMATEMIRYSNTCREKLATQEEALRVLEHGLSFLLRDGSGATAAGRVLLMIANLHTDRAKYAEAQACLEQAGNLCSASPEVRVAAYEALAGLCLRLREDELAMRHARDAVYMAEAAACGDWSEGGPDALLAMKARGHATVGLVARASGDPAEASAEFGEVEKVWEARNGAGASGMRMGATAGAKLSHALELHARGRLFRATEMYAQALEGALADDCSRAVASLCMQPQEVAVGALAGLGQLAMHAGDYEVALGRLTEALSRAERISGERHPRVGVVLALMGIMYRHRAQALATNEGLLAEGLFRRALELLGAPIEMPTDNDRNFDFADVVALAEAHCGEVLGWIKGRESQALRLKARAEADWRGHLPFKEALERGDPLKDKNTSQGEHSFAVIDVRLGRLIV